MLRRLLVVTIFTHKLGKELKLMKGILYIVLLNATEDHSVEGWQVGVVELGSFLKHTIGSLIVSEQALLVSDFIVVVRILWAEHDCLIQDL